MPKKKATKPHAGAKIPQAEWEVMRVLWDANAPLSAAEVVARLEEKSDWNPKTIRTFLNRLVQKQAIKAQKRAGFELLHYTPLIDEVSMLQAKQETFVGQFFGGTVRSMLAGCIQSGEISVEELLQLREMIDRQVHKSRNGA
jgi:BlaI family penicillinase repressor